MLGGQQANPSSCHRSPIVKPHQEILLITSLAILWFAATLFSIYPLVPGLAFPSPLVAFVGVMIVYQILDVTDYLSVGAIITIFLIPLICIAAGVVWWGIRLLGFPGITED
jgi:hypothetical protein